MATKKRFILRGRSAKSGRFIPLSRARKNKSSSVIERLPLRRGHKKK